MRFAFGSVRLYDSQRAIDAQRQADDLAGLALDAPWRNRFDPRRDADLLARPDVATLLAVDADYRDRSARGKLRRIAPRRFNPERKAWLPILHTGMGNVHGGGGELARLFRNRGTARDLHAWT